MTIREQLNRQVRWVYPLLFLAMGVFFLGGMLAAAQVIQWPWHMLIGSAIFFPVFIFMTFGIKCPSCRKMLFGCTWAVGGKIFSVGKRMQFCPRCGVDLDTEPKEVPTTGGTVRR